MTGRRPAPLTGSSARPEPQGWGVAGVFVSYGKTVALGDVSLAAAAGQVTAVVGGDGAGKSTLLRCLAGLISPASGEVRTPGAARIGYLPGSSGIYPDLTVTENLEFRAAAYGMAPAQIRARAAEFLDRTGLADVPDRMAGQLSGGMRQKLGVIAAMLHQPDLLVLDEPTTGVDPVSRSDLWWLIARAAAAGTAVVLATSYLDEAERAATVLVLDGGRELAAGTPAQIVAAVPGVILVSPVRPAGPAAQRAWRRSGEWRIWMPRDSPSIRSAQQVQPDLQDAVTVAALARELRLQPPVAGADSRGQDGAVRDCGVRDGGVRDSGSAGQDGGGQGSAGGSAMASAGAGSAGAGSAGAGSAGGPAAGSASPAAERPSQAAGRTAAEPLRPARPGLSRPLAQCLAVSRSFGNFTAVRDVDLRVEPGEIVGLLGANGAGKTTIIRMLLGLLPASAGEVLLFGSPPSRETRRQIGYVPQGLGLYDDLTVTENLNFTAAVFGSKPSALTAVSAADLTAPVGRLPLGLQRRVAFAAALSHRPELLILDEPTSGVDPLGRARLWETISASARNGAGVLVTTHYLEEATECTRLVIMADGAVVAEGTAAEIIGDARVTVVTGPSWATAFARLENAGFPVTLGGQAAGGGTGTVLRVPGADPVAVRRALGADGAAVQEVPATLEERFFQLTMRRSVAGVTS